MAAATIFCQLASPCACASVAGDQAAALEFRGDFVGLFAQAAASEGALAQQVRAVATLRGEYRLSHLETHRRMRALLSDEQVHRYVQLRGYGSGSSATGTHANPHQH